MCYHCKGDQGGTSGEEASDDWHIVVPCLYWDGHACSVVCFLSSFLVVVVGWLMVIVDCEVGWMTVSPVLMVVVVGVDVCLRACECECGVMRVTKKKEGKRRMPRVESVGNSKKEGLSTTRSKMPTRPCLSGVAVSMDEVAQIHWCQSHSFELLLFY